MPMIRSRYPRNWNKIAHAIKEAAGWQCQGCGRPCRLPGENRGDFVDRLGADHPQWWPDIFSDEATDPSGLHSPGLKLGRFTLTVAHLDHNPANCAPENLRALCSVCHCRYDLQPGSMAIKRKLKAEWLGQLSLFEI